MNVCGNWKAQWTHHVLDFDKVNQVGLSQNAVLWELEMRKHHDVFIIQTDLFLNENASPCLFARQLGVTTTKTYVLKDEMKRTKHQKSCFHVVDKCQCLENVWLHERQSCLLKQWLIQIAFEKAEIKKIFTLMENFFLGKCFGIWLWRVRWHNKCEQPQSDQHCQTKVFTTNAWFKF